MDSNSPLRPGEQPPRRIALAGTRIRLEPLDPERDAPELYAASHGSAEREAVWDWMPVGPFADVAALRAHLEERLLDPDAMAFAVVDVEDGRRIGMACYLAIAIPARRLEVGFIWYTPSHQRGRANNEAMYLMLREAFEHVGCRRVEWKCDALNLRSRRAALRLGFSYEGEFRQHLIVKGRNRDTSWFSMLDSEWPTAKARLETALDA